MIEWFLIGLAPWRAPAANPVSQVVFQLGMFSFWATVAFAPRLFLNPQALNKKTRQAILRFYVPYFIFVYIVSVVIPTPLKFVTIISLIILGYLVVNVLCLKYFRQSFLHSASPKA